LDLIQGIDAASNISDGFIYCLNSHDIFFWHQVRSSWQDKCPIWKKALELRLDEHMAREWEHIRSNMQLARVFREVERDQIAWTNKMKEAGHMVVDTYFTL